MESNSSTNSATSTGASLSQATGDVDTLWKHVTKIAKIKERGGNTKIKCNFCNNEFTGSYSRVKAHLLKIKGQGVAVCSKVTPELLREFQRELAEAEERRRPIDIPLPPSSQTQSCSAWEGIERRQIQESKKRPADPNNPINKAYKMEMRSLLDSEIAGGFFSGGLPFHYARNPHHIKSYTMASEFNLVGYVPPTYNTLRTTLLQKERIHVERLMDPIKTTWKEKGVTIVSDGWSDTQRRPLINFMAVTELGPMFIKAVNCEGNVKDKFFMADLIKEVIMQVGPQNVVQVIFGSADSIEDRGTEDPKMWWLIHGASAPNLQKIALKLLGQPCSSSCCKRNWSTYSFIHSVKRNKILPSRAEDLVYVHTNLRLLSRKSELYRKGETKLWDIGGDRFDPFDGAEELEIASLSLDEPEMEAMIIEDE